MSPVFAGLGLIIRARNALQGILFASASKRGFGLQTMWGHGFMMAHMSLPGGKTCWSGPCYCYVSGSTHVGVGEGYCSFRHDYQD